jgi:hypothetical protein
MKQGFNFILTIYRQDFMQLVNFGILSAMFDKQCPDEAVRFFLFLVKFAI